MKDRAEHKVLILVARRELNRDQQLELRSLLKDVVDWEYLFATASVHGLVPLIHKNLSAHARDVIPLSFLSRLKRASVANATNVLHLLSKQLKVHSLLTDNGIPVAIFKGSVLAEMAYGEISLRQAGDIDVLIRRVDFDRVRKLLESLGYQMTPSLTHAQLNSHLASHCEIQFMRDGWFTVVDLHWALAPKSFVFKMDTDKLMDRLQTVKLLGSEIRTLATEDLILYLSMHGAKHLWRSIEWITSLGELIHAAETIAWDTVIERAAKARATRMLALGLRLTERVSGTRAPAEVLLEVDGDLSMDSMARGILGQIFNANGPADSTETNLYNLKIMDRKRDALVSALRSIFVPTLTDWHALNLPPSLHSLYYAYRPLRLSKVYSSSLLRKLSSKGAACL